MYHVRALKDRPSCTWLSLISRSSYNYCQSFIGSVCSSLLPKELFNLAYLNSAIDLTDWMSWPRLSKLGEGVTSVF